MGHAKAPGLCALGLCALGALAPCAAVGESARPVAPPTDQASADCAAPTFATDHLVCADAALRALDAEVARLWARAEATGMAGASARDAQTAWLRQRSLCAFEADHRACAERSYKARITALRALLGDG